MPYCMDLSIPGIKPSISSIKHNNHISYQEVKKFFLSSSIHNTCLLTCHMSEMSALNVFLIWVKLLGFPKVLLKLIYSVTQASPM